MKGWKAVLWTIGLVFAVTVGAQWLALGNDIFHTSLATWQMLVNGGVAAVIALVVNWAAPWIDRYGVGSGK